MQTPPSDVPLAAAAALFLVLVAAGKGHSAPLPPPSRDGGARILVFRVPGFPTVDAPEIPGATLDQALAGQTVTVAGSADGLSKALAGGESDILVLPYGSAFPLESWPAIKTFLKGGGNLVVLGGAPFEQPVRSGAAGAFAPATRQPTFAHELLIGPVDRIDSGDIASPRVAAVEGSGWTAALPRPAHTFALTVRLATRKDMPGEHGSEGPRDAVLRPLVHVIDRDGLPRACPLLAIDRIRGTEAGGRWVLAPSDAALDAAAIREAVLRAAEGAALLEARPVRASVEPGETAALRVTLLRPRPRPGESVPARAAVRVTNDAGAEVWKGEAALSGQPEGRTGLVSIAPAAPLPPGLYHAEVSVPGAPWHPLSTTTGFWVKDAALLASGPRLTVSRDWLRRDGAVLPVIGTTYMASDVHRKFLFEPNPHLWDRDFRAMHARGINLVRTGIWTAWSRFMLDPGAADENVLSALEAYVMSAARNQVEVCFTFFAFQPPYYGGSHPFLDPRGLEGQRALLTLVAGRFRGVPWVHWDLINEPSYSPPEGIWSNRPVGDANERQAWAAWLQARHGDDAASLREAWRIADEGNLDPPQVGDLSYQMIREARVPRKGYEFSVFSQEMAARWAGTLRAILKAAGGDLLVTLGQDEGGTQNRPAQQIYAADVDYTSVHTWWNNDDLLWDGVVTKVPEKPNLHQETGLMRLEDPDGNPWRTPEMAARLLERKVAYAFASRGAGVVQWAWNINPYQPIDNESVIGLFRPDGTAKPELRALTDLAPFFAQAAPWLDDFEPDPVVMVIPHARLFSARMGDLDATKRVVRLLAERYGVVPTALSDQRLSAERLQGAKLVLVPAPEILEEAAARALLAAARAGALVLITGAVEGDPYGRVPEALKALGVVDAGRPVAQHERTPWGSGWATFDNHASERLRRASNAAPTRREGLLWHEPLPLELAREPEPIAALLGAALQAAGVAVSPSDTNVVARVLSAPRAHLVVCVNETAEDAVRRVQVDGRALDVPVPAGRTRLVLVERAGGKVLAATPGGEVK